MNTIGQVVAGAMTSGNEEQGYAPGGSFFEELIALPEYAIYVMLAIRVLLLIVGDPRKSRPLSSCNRACTWNGWRVACTCG